MSKNMKNFLVLEKIGNGAFSQVYKVKRISDGELYAMKRIKMKDLNQKERKNSLTEI